VEEGSEGKKGKEGNLGWDVQALLFQQQQQQQQQLLFTKHIEYTMMEGQQGYEKHLWPPAHNKKERKMNNLNNRNLALKSVHLASLYL